jgi:2-hydroxychromene-2-carboxylate isomerase
VPATDTITAAGLVEITARVTDPEAIARIRTAHTCHAIVLAPGATTFWVAPDSRDAVRASIDDALAAPRDPDVVVYFDFNSPWSYASTAPTGPLARISTTVHWRGFELLPQWRPAYDVTSPPAAQRWQQARAALDALGLPAGTDRPPLRRTRRAHLAVLHAAVSGGADMLMRALLEAHWSTEADIDNVNDIKDIAFRAGLNGLDIAEAVAAELHADTLAATRADAVAHGVFGVPTVRVGPTVVWGRDLTTPLQTVLATEASNP